MNGRRVLAPIAFHSEFCPCRAEVSQRKSKGDSLVELRRMDGAADPAYLTIAAVEFGSMGRYDGILQDKPDEFAAHIAIGIHARDNFLSWIASFVETERFSLKVGFRWNDLFVQIWPSFRRPASMRKASRAWVPIALIPNLAPACNALVQAVRRLSTGRRTSISTSPVSSVRNTSAECPPICAVTKSTGFKSVTSTPNAD